MGYESKLMDFGEDWDELMIYDHPHFQSTSHTQDPSKAPPPAAKEEDGVLKAKSAQKSEDVFGRLVLGFLAGLLPSLDRETCFDIAPPAAVFEMLMDSKILVYCAELLRNDSLEDVVKRKDLFQTLFQFLTIVGSHSATSQVLVIPRPVRPDSIDLLTLSFCVPPPHKDTTQSLTECLRNLATQSTLVLQSVKNNEDDFQTEEGQEMLCICRQISGLAQHIQSNITMEAGDAKTTRATDLVISDVEDKLLLSTHYHASKATSLTYSQPGRFKRLITEISTLQTGLPPGIFVRYCENRPDVLKCIIIGPRGSPYENGLFEFDIFCGADFPTSPPQVNFKGTGGGRVSINPNLYADGKVCLSLLGTWSGEPWKPNESTLLQVLISIQAMILCEEPWYNEPGREAGYSDSENGPSARYNKTIREHTVRYAILNWLDKPPQLWQEVVDQHFRRNCNAVLKTVEDWTKAKAAPVPPRKRFADFADEEYYDYDELMSRRGSTLDKADMGTMLNRLKTELQRYGATFVVQYVPPPVVQQHPAPHPGSSQHLPSSVQTLSPIVPSPSLLYSSFHPLPGYMPPLHTPHTPSLPHLQGHSFRGGFWGRGQVLENEPGGQSAALVTPNFRGGSVQRGSSDVPTSGRYETRSTTRGRGENDMMSGGRSVLSGPSNGRGRGAPRGRGAGESAGNFYPASFGSNNSNGQRGHGGRGDRGGRGGRGAPSS
jgi:ubiquitin-protein ligase